MWVFDVIYQSTAVTHKKTSVSHHVFGARELDSTSPPGKQLEEISSCQIFNRPLYIEKNGD